MGLAGEGMFTASSGNGEGSLPFQGKVTELFPSCLALLSAAPLSLLPE